MHVIKSLNTHLKTGGMDHSAALAVSESHLLALVRTLTDSHGY